jgi:hypothetical protein
MSNRKSATVATGKDKPGCASVNGYRAGLRVRLTKNHKWSGEVGTILIGYRVNNNDGWEIELDNGTRCWARESRIEAL